MNGCPLTLRNLWHALRPIKLVLCGEHYDIITIVVGVRPSESYLLRSRVAPLKRGWASWLHLDATIVLTKRSIDPPSLLIYCPRFPSRLSFVSNGRTGSLGAPATAIALILKRWIHCIALRKSLKTSLQNRRVFWSLRWFFAICNKTFSSMYERTSLLADIWWNWYLLNRWILRWCKFI